MQTATVLIVDDNPVDRELVERMLGNDYQFLSAATGHEGLDVCRYVKPACVILDYRLPDEDGVALLPRFLEHKVGVIMLTGLGDESVAVACLRGGAHDYLSKSELTRENLERAVRNATEKAHLIHEVDLHQRIVNMMPIGVAVFECGDPAEAGSLRLLWQNPAAMHMARPEKAGAGSMRRAAIPDLLDASVPALVAATLKSGTPQSMPEARSRDGRVYALNTAPIGGGLAAVLFEDITLQHRALEDKRKMETQMRAAQRLEAVGRLAGGVAHDFNNILTAIQSYALFVREQLPPEGSAVEDVDTILDAANRAAKLTSQLLAFSRRQVQALRVVNLNGVVIDIDRMLRRLIGEDIDLVTRVDDALHPVRVDPTQMEQVIVNLAVNARDAMPRGGRLTIETKNVDVDEEYGAQHGVEVPTGHYVMLAVTDSGSGIDPETRQHIFEPFFTTKGKEGGTGLGLSTVFGIVKQSGGFIFVYSEVGHGTSFKIYLPSVSAPVDAATIPKAEPSVLAGTETVLVVEDEEVVRKAIGRVLGGRGYTVLEASAATDAIRLADTHEGPIHLLVTDIVMPHVGGLDLAKEITKRRPETKVVYMSGYTGHALVHRCMVDENTAFLQKPYTTEALLRTVRQVLDGSEP